MTRTTGSLFAAPLLALTLAGCGGAQGKATAPSGEGKPPVAVETARVTRSDLVETVDVVGTLAPKFDALVKAEHAGIVAEVYVTEWVTVKRGTALARLDEREAGAALQGAEASVLQAEAASTRARREHERAVKLREAGLMTEQQVADARTADEAAEAALEAARAQARLARTRLDKAVIRAPIDGVVAMRAVSPGDKAEGDPLFRIVDTRLFDLEASVPSGEIHRVRIGQPLTFTTHAVPGQTFSGEVAFINPAADPASRTVSVVAEVPDPDGVLRAGLFVEGSIRTGSRAGVLQVPRPALVSWDLAAGKAEVYQVEGGRARRQTVATGESAGELVEVTSGLEPGDEVVTRGGFLLRDGDRVTVIAAEAPEA